MAATTRTVLRAVPRDDAGRARTDRCLGAALGALARAPGAPAGTADALGGWRRLAGPLRGPATPRLPAAGPLPRPVPGAGRAR